MTSEAKIISYKDLAQPQLAKVNNEKLAPIVSTTHMSGPPLPRPFIIGKPRSLSTAALDQLFDTLGDDKLTPIVSTTRLPGPPPPRPLPKPFIIGKPRSLSTAALDQLFDTLEDSYAPNLWVTPAEKRQSKRNPLASSLPAGICLPSTVPLVSSLPLPPIPLKINRSQSQSSNITTRPNV